MSNRGLTVTKKIRSERRAIAEASLAEYNKLSLQQKIDGLPPAPGAAKQRARLLGLAAKKTEKAEAAPAVVEASPEKVQEKPQKKSKKSQQ